MSNFSILQVQCQVSLKRINKYMNSEELDPYAVSHSHEAKDAVYVSNATFSWERDGKPTINDVSFKVKNPKRRWPQRETCSFRFQEAI